MRKLLLAGVAACVMGGCADFENSAWGLKPGESACYLHETGINTKPFKERDIGMPWAGVHSQQECLAIQARAQQVQAQQDQAQAQARQAKAQARAQNPEKWDVQAATYAALNSARTSQGHLEAREWRGGRGGYSVQTTVPLSISANFDRAAVNSAASAVRNEAMMTCNECLARRAVSADRCDQVFGWISEAVDLWVARGGFAPG